MNQEVLGKYFKIDERGDIFWLWENDEWVQWGRMRGRKIEIMPSLANPTSTYLWFEIFEMKELVELAEKWVKG